VIQQQGDLVLGEAGDGGEGAVAQFVEGLTDLVAEGVVHAQAMAADGTTGGDHLVDHGRHVLETAVLDEAGERGAELLQVAGVAG